MTAPMLLRLGSFLAFLAVPRVVHAQEGPGGPVPPSERVESLRRGTPAPFDGILVEPVLHAWYVQRIERLEFRLSADLAREAERQAVLLDLERARTRAADDRLVLHTGLWQDRVTAAERRTASVQRQLERERRGSIWTQPLFWYIAGVVTVVVLVGSGALLFAN